MKVLLRILLVILSLVLLAGLVAILATLAEIPWLSQYVGQMMQRYFWLPTAMAIIVLFFAVVTLAFVFFALLFPTRRKFYALQQGANTLEISPASIISSVGLSLDQIPELKRYHVRLKGNPSPHKLKLSIEAEARNVSNYDALAAEINQRLCNDLSTSLAIKPSHIKTRILKYQVQYATQHAHATPRVI